MQSVESPSLNGEVRGGGEEEAALRRYLCLGPEESSITRLRFTGPEMAASLGLTTQELEIIFSALDADNDDVITLDELLEQWPQDGEAESTGNSEQTWENFDQLNSSSFTTEGEGSLCYEDSETNHIADEFQHHDAVFKVIAEDRHKDRDGGAEYNRTRRRSSLLLHILDSRAASPHSLLSSTPSFTSLQHESGIKTAEHLYTEPMLPVSSSLTLSTTSPGTSPSAPPPILSPLSPRHVVDVFPHMRKTVREEETDTDSFYTALSGISSAGLSGLGDSSLVFSPPTSPTGLASTSTPTHKAVKCDYSCVHPSKLTLTDLMASSLQDSFDDSCCASSGGCKDTHRHVRRKIRAGSSINDPKSPVVADPSLQDIIPKETRRNQALEIFISPDSSSSMTYSGLHSNYCAEDGTASRKGFLRPPAGSDRQSRWSSHQYSAIDGTTPTIRKLRPKSPRPEKAGSRKLVPLRGPSSSEPIDMELSRLSKTSQEQVCELYQNLHTADNPDLLTQFENIVLNVIHDVRHYQLENERLEKTYQREKDEHLKHLRRLEEEMEQQVQSVEERVRRQEKEKLESEKVELRNTLDSEIVMLQQNLTKLQADGGSSLVKGQEEHLNNLKKRLEEIQHENRALKSELTDAQTNLALTRSQMTSVKQKLEEKNHELEVENKTVEDYLNEQDKLRRQLQMLHEANKTLLDTNDNLRELLDSSPVASQAYKRQGSTDFELGALYKSGHSTRSAGRNPRCIVDQGSPGISRKGSVMSDYVDAHPGNRPPLLSFNTGMMPRFLNESCDEDALIEDLGDHNNFLSPDSGHSTLRDLAEVNDDTELDSISIQSDLRRGRRHKRHRAHLKAPEEEEDDSHDEMDSDPENIPTREVNGFRLPDRPKRSPSAGSRGSNRSQRSLHREDSVLSHSSRSSRGSSRRQLPALPSAEIPSTPPAPPKDPDRVHRIYMAGDAAVGKTSFIFRICKGKFVANLSSTLGMDFYTKMLDVDGNNTVMELWDTAGQERFRAMTRTYFRRADGVLLLYDVTYERSFLNVREWVNAIEEGAVKKLPIMLVGNKTDLRDEMEKQGRRVVRYEDGLRLSKEIDALFIETSAKDGSNITEAVIELTRLLRTNQDLEVKSVGMQIHEMSSKKNSSCCSRS